MITEAARLGRIRQHLGKPVTHLIPELLQFHPEISVITLVAYRPAPALSERLDEAIDPAPSIRERADAVHRQYGVAFWDAVLAIAMKNDQLPESYVDLAICHDSDPDEHSIPLSVEEISASRIQEIVGSLKPDYALAISSRVGLVDGRAAHLPMMDFRCPHSARNIAIIKRALTAMHQEEGVLALSPRSYHFYGLELLHESDWMRFLGMAMLFSPVVDARYIAHRLADQACRLRLSATAGKGDAPIVVDTFP